jgi:hypothetical protein
LIRPDAIGELKDGAAGLVALSELFASRRVGPKSVARSLASVMEACAGVERAAERLAADVVAVAREHPEAVAEIQALHDRAVSSVRALASEAEAASRSAVDARTRLVLERAAHDACARVATALFAGELFALAALPRPVTVHVADVLSFGPLLPEGPSVVRATLDVPAEPVTTTDARLLRALVELCVQVVAAAGIARPHVEVAASEPGGARIRVGPPRTAGTAQAGSPTQGAQAGGSVLTIRKLPWPDGVRSLVRAAASMAGAAAVIDAAGRGVTLELP